MNTTPCCLLAALLPLSALCAQAVDYPSPTLANPPQIAFPFYTPGGGSTGQTVRMQCLCPASFLAVQNLGAGLVTRIGFSLAGEGVYDVFELRAGVTTATALGSDWTVNLPDQRLQRDLANVLLQGGGSSSAPSNQWVEFDLDVPFAWQPGQGIVVDLVTRIAVPGSYLLTTVGAGVPRAVNFAYTSGAGATSLSGSGTSFRMVFAPPDLVTFGAGCSRPGGVSPWLSSVGTAATGNTMTVVANQVLDGTVGGFLWGHSRSTLGGVPLPLALGGGCSLRVTPDLFVVVPIAPSGGGLGTAAFPLVVPNDPMLVGSVLYTQYAQFDALTPATVPLTFSDAGIVVVL